MKSAFLPILSIFTAFYHKGVCSVAVTPGGSGLATSIATQATILSEAQVQNAVGVALLSKALDVQKTAAAELLKLLGIGQNVDIAV